MRNWKLFGKIGAIALTALGLALVPGDFNVPGVGTVEAYADPTTIDLTDATVSLTNRTGVYTADGQAPTIGSVRLDDGSTLTSAQAAKLSLHSTGIIKVLKLCVLKLNPMLTLQEVIQ